YESGVSASGTSDDVASVLETAARVRTWPVWTNGRVGEHRAMALMARVLPDFDPGTATWAFNTVAGVSEYTISSTVQTTLESKQVNYFASVGGVHVSLFGTMSSGRFIDLTHAIDWMQARAREKLQAILVANPKLPYTDNAVAIVEGTIRTFLESLTTGPTPVLAEVLDVSVPAVADVDASDRAARLLPDVTFSARYASAVHKIDADGFLAQ